MRLADRDARLIDGKVRRKQARQCAVPRSAGRAQGPPETALRWMNPRRGCSGRFVPDFGPRQRADASSTCITHYNRR